MMKINNNNMNTTLCPLVTDILSRSTITETLLVLSPSDAGMGRPLYDKVAKVIKLAGGAWKTNKQGFVFTSDPRAKLGLALESGVVVDEKKLRQAFYTPEAIAIKVARHANVRGLVVLEPSAGQGSLAKACITAGALAVDCVEKDPSCREVLAGINGSLWMTDFLLANQTISGVYYTRIVMNPPFSKGQDLKHVTHALNFLAPGGLLFAIVPSKDCPKFAAMGAKTVEVFAAGSFKESGTNIETRLIQIESNHLL